MFGLMSAFMPAPRLENGAMTLSASKAPELYAALYPPGVPVVPHDGPALPLEKAGKMPAATQESTIWLYHGSRAPEPQELFTTSGARSGRGLRPDRSVGATIHWPAASSAAREQENDSQPLAAIQVAPGATPIWSAPSGIWPPTI